MDKVTLLQCQINECSLVAEYGIYYTNANGEKVWLNVCGDHERIIGNENMRRAGGRYVKDNDR